jgi:hypothetical protein
MLTGDTRLAAQIAALDPFTAREARLARHGRAAGICTTLRGTAAILARMVLVPAGLR